MTALGQKAGMLGPVLEVRLPATADIGYRSPRAYLFDRIL